MLRPIDGSTRDSHHFGLREVEANPFQQPRRRFHGTSEIFLWVFKRRANRRSAGQVINCIRRSGEVCQLTEIRRLDLAVGPVRIRPIGGGFWRPKTMADTKDPMTLLGGESGNIPAYETLPSSDPDYWHIRT